MGEQNFAADTHTHTRCCQAERPAFHQDCGALPRQWSASDNMPVRHRMHRHMPCLLHTFLTFRERNTTNDVVQYRTPAMSPRASEHFRSSARGAKARQAGSAVPQVLCRRPLRLCMFTGRMDFPNPFTSGGWNQDLENGRSAASTDFSSPRAHSLAGTRCHTGATQESQDQNWSKAHTLPCLHSLSPRRGSTCRTVCLMRGPCG